MPWFFAWPRFTRFSHFCLFTIVYVMSFSFSCWWIYGQSFSLPSSILAYCSFSNGKTDSLVIFSLYMQMKMEFGIYRSHHMVGWVCVTRFVEQNSSTIFDGSQWNLGGKVFVHLGWKCTELCSLEHILALLSVIKCINHPHLTGFLLLRSWLSLLKK